MGYYDEAAGAELHAAFGEPHREWPRVASTTMFSYPSYRAGGTLFAVLDTDGIALTRLPRRE